MYYFLKPCENSTCSPALAEESSAECFSDIPASVLSRLMSTAEKSFCNGSETESCHGSRSGMMSELLMGTPGVESWRSSVLDSHAKILVPQIQQASESKGKEAVFGVKSRESFVKFDHDSYSWKIHQHSLLGGLESFSETWPTWGEMHNGECFQLAPLVHHIHAPACSYWPTPRASDKDNCGGSGARKKAQRLGTYVGRKQNPQLTEWLMGWPIGWTDLKPLETAKFQQWLNSHGKP